MTTQLRYALAQNDTLFNGLKRMCVPDFWSADSPVLRPFAIELDGEPWTAFTEGHVMVAVRGKRKGVKPYSGKHNDSLKRTLALLGSVDGTWQHAVSFPALREWVDVSHVGKCPLCLGTGHDAEGLSDAEVSNRINRDEPRIGLLYGLPVQRLIVEIPFAYLQAETVDVCVPEATGQPFLIVAPDWKLLWMPLTEWDEEGLSTFPAAASA